MGRDRHRDGLQAGRIFRQLASLTPHLFEGGLVRRAEGHRTDGYDMGAEVQVINKVSHIIRIKEMETR